MAWYRRLLRNIRTNVFAGDHKVCLRSTALVDNHSATFVAEVYKSISRLRSADNQVRRRVITAYNGDRIMGIFIGNAKRTDAARAALKINDAMIHVVNPIAVQYRSGFRLRHSIGVDCTTILAARIGVRSDNDIVWVGREISKIRTVLTGRNFWRARLCGEPFSPH